MCSISGFNWVDENLIIDMNRILKDRGPDDEDIYVDEAVSLGHTRLSIIDLSEKGHQPMSDINNKFYIAYNGEIYNFKEIREELEKFGYTFNSKTDAEVVLYSYIKWGKKCLEKFNGMFAFVVYDKEKKKLFIARDRIGIKPLYYFYDGKRFIFASEIPAILIHEIDTTPNKEMIRDFLLYNITDHTSKTFFTHIYKILKGNYAIFDLVSNGLQMKEWWHIKFENSYSGSYSQSVTTLQELLTDSVNKRLISDVPVGTCLSGGIDSSAITCLINETKKTEIRTFSAVYPAFSKDESRYIDMLGTKTGIKNFKVNPTAKTLKRDLLAFTAVMGEPVSSPSPYAQYCVHKLAKENDVTVLLDGQGSDELFAGYHYFWGFYLQGLLRKLKIGTVLKELVYLSKGGHFKIGILSLLFLLTPLSIRNDYFTWKSNISRELLRDENATTTFFKDYYTCKSLSKALEFHMNCKLEHLLKWDDRNSMAHSREARVPFLDHRIIEFVSGLPEDFIISKGKTKGILRDALKGIVPEDILDRRDKIGFATPEDEWLRSEEFNELLNNWFLQATPKCAPYIDLHKTRKIIKKHIDNRKNHGKVLWKTIFLEAWLRNYFGGVET